VPAPAGAGAWRDSHGWSTSDFTLGWAEGSFYPSLAWATTFRAREERYKHGYLVTLWTNYHLGNYLPACNICAKRLTADFTLRAGTSLNSVGAASVSVQTTPWNDTAGGATDSGYRFASAPRNYGHVVIWVPRAWGRPTGFRVKGALTLYGGGIGYSTSLSASYGRAVYAMYDRK
jgi:hypothetical protein